MCDFVFWWNAFIAQFIGAWCIYTWAFPFNLEPDNSCLHLHTGQSDIEITARVSTITNSKINERKTKYAGVAFAAKLFQSRNFNTRIIGTLDFLSSVRRSRQRRMKIMKFTSAKNIATARWWLGKKTAAAKINENISFSKLNRPQNPVCIFCFLYVTVDVRHCVSSTRSKSRTSERKSPVWYTHWAFKSSNLIQMREEGKSAEYIRKWHTIWTTREWKMP